MQVSLAVFSIAVGQSPRGTAARSGLPWAEISTIVLATLAVGALVWIIPGRTRRLCVTWGIAAALASADTVAGLVVGVLVSLSAQYYFDLLPPDRVLAASDAAATTTMIGALLMIIAVLLLPVVAPIDGIRRRWAEAIYLGLVVTIGFYGVVPVIWQLAAFG